MNKQSILKIAGVKSEKEFYKKYPSEEAFMKVHGKAFKKAQMGAAINKAQGGILQGPEQAPSNNYYQNNNPYFATNPGATGLNNPSIAAPTASGSFDIMPYAQAATSVLGGLQTLGAQKKALKEARMWNKVTGLQARAAESVDVDANRPKNYVRPEDQIVNPNELFPTYGVGTNVLAKNGAEIQNTYAPGTLYDDLGYEPLEDSSQIKQYYHGGGIHQMQDGGYANSQDYYNQIIGAGNNTGIITGGAQALGMLSNAFSDNSGGSQIGSGLGTGIGTAFGGPVGGAIGGALGSIVGGAFDNTGRKIKKEQKGIERNVNRVMGAQFARGLQGQYGSYMEEGGQITNPQLITRFGELDQQDFYDYAHEGMDSLRAGGHLREYTPISERGMEQYAMGGEVKTTWGGHAETISQNPYMPGTGETIMFRGKSHDESDGNGHTGIGVKYGAGKHDSYTDYAEYGTQNADAHVEVERGEPAAELQDANGEKNLTVYGNLKIPNQYIDMLGDPKAKGKKFKNYIAEISKDEDKQTKLIDKSTSLLNDLDVRNSFDKLKFESLTANINGANMKLKSIADKKKNAAYLQNAINDTAEEYGLVADDLAKGKAKINKEALQEYAEYGKNLKKYQNAPEPIYASDKASTGNNEIFSQIDELYEKAQEEERKHPGRKNKYHLQLQQLFHKNFPEVAKNIIINADGVTGKAKKMGYKTINDLKKASDEEILKTNEDLYFGPRTEQYMAELDKLRTKRNRSADFSVPEISSKKNKTDNTKEKDNKYEITEYKQSPWLTALNQILPFIRPTDQEPLDPRQLSGELYALSTNQLEPVQAQGYQPDLATPYDISLQDQMNEITAQTRAAQRMTQGNPAAQAAIAAQAYDAINKVKGEEFRANQAMRANIFDQNRQALNDAKLKNLAIFDQQYTRQEQAKSNTKAIAQAALNSISDKYAKNRLENRTLGIYENLYNYRYDPSGRAINMNPLFQPYIMQRYPQYKDANYKINPDGSITVIQNKTTEYTDIPPTATPTYVNNRQTSSSGYLPNTYTSQEEEDIFAPLPQKNGGKTKKKIAMNGSIVKMYKTV
jgi:hypothetical protein